MKIRSMNQWIFSGILLINSCVALLFVNYNSVLFTLSFLTGLMILYLIIFMRKWYLIVASTLLFFFQFFYTVVNDKNQYLLRVKEGYYKPEKDSSR
jgi:hypothetical protein